MNAKRLIVIEISSCGRVLLFCQPSEICMGNVTKALALCAAQSHIAAVR
jgi:hypothetical protein